MVRRKRRREGIRFELIPMIDVFMIITLFLAVMAFLPQITDSLKAELPTSTTADKTPPSVVVQLSLDGKLHFQEQPIEVAVLQERLKVLIQEKPETAVIVAADKSLPYSKVVTLIDLLKEAGVRRLALAAAKP